MEKPEELTPLEVDALNEIGNVATGNAATSLSKFLNKNVDMNIPKSEFVPLKDFADCIGGAEKIVSAIYLKISGDLTGEVTFVFPKLGAMEIVDLASVLKVDEASDLERLQQVAKVMTDAAQGTQSKVGVKAGEAPPTKFGKADAVKKKPASEAKEGAMKEGATKEEKVQKGEEKEEEEKANATPVAPDASAASSGSDSDHPILKEDVGQDYNFITHEGKPIKNVHSLLGYVKDLDEGQFKDFVNEERRRMIPTIWWSMRSRVTSSRVSYRTLRPRRMSQGRV